MSTTTHKQNNLPNKKSLSNISSQYNIQSNTYYSNTPFSNESIRIIKRNLVYVINLDPKIADKEILMKREYFGQYGKITKVLVNLNKAYNSNNNSAGLSYSAYINYSSNYEAALAILSIDSCVLNNKVLKAAFGTTKYCSYYMKKQSCPIKDCVYMHTVSDKTDIISKDSADFYVDQHKLAIKIADIYNDKVKETLYKTRNDETVLPNPYSIYSKRSLLQLGKKSEDKENNCISSEVNGPKQKTLRDILGGEMKDNEEDYMNIKISQSDKESELKYRTPSNNSGLSSNQNAGIVKKPSKASLKINENEEKVSSNNSISSSISPNKVNKIKLIENNNTSINIINSIYGNESIINRISDKEKEYKESIILEPEEKSENKIKESIKINNIIKRSMPNKRQLLFNLNKNQPCSRFDFTNISNDVQIDVTSDEKVNFLSEDEKIIKNYFLRFSFSSAFCSHEKKAFEEHFYKSIYNTSVKE